MASAFMVRHSLGNPWIGRFVEHHHLLYEDLADPLALLRGQRTDTSLRRFWAYAGSASPETARPEETSAYTQLMAASQQAVAGEILAAYDFGQHRHLIDVGGSNGTFIARAAARHPALALTLFDLPGVVSHARELGRHPRPWRQALRSRRIFSLRSPSAGGRCHYADPHSP